MALTRQALFLSQEQGSYPELTYRWQWQIGRIFTHLGQFADAQQAYELAINTLNPIRGQFFNGYRKDIGTLFREQIKPVYYELAGVHLQQAQISKDTDERQHRLSQVQGIIEQMKSAELQDLFQDECIVALNNKKEKPGPSYRVYCSALSHNAGKRASHSSKVSGRNLAVQGRGHPRTI